MVKQACRSSHHRRALRPPGRVLLRLPRQRARRSLVKQACRSSHHRRSLRPPGRILLRLPRQRARRDGRLRRVPRLLLRVSQPPLWSLRHLRRQRHHLRVLRARLCRAPHQPGPRRLRGRCRARVRGPRIQHFRSPTRRSRPFGPRLGVGESGGMRVRARPTRPQICRCSRPPNSGRPKTLHCAALVGGGGGLRSQCFTAQGNDRWSMAGGSAAPAAGCPVHDGSRM